MLTRPWPPPPRPGGRIAPLAPRGGVTVRSMRTLPLLLSMLAGPAWAFPGTFVGPDGEAPAVEAAYVVLARQGDRTTLTVAPRLDAESPQVALVLPLPTGDVHHVADVPPSYLQRVTGFAAPRIGPVTCDDLIDDRYHPTGPGCGSFDPAPKAPPPGPQATGSVALDTTWALGDWDARLVRVQEGDDGLQEWLDDEGLALPEGAAASLADFDWFLVAKLAPEDGEMLQPLQVAYRDPDFVLPIRPGGAPGAVQDLVITAITDASAGAVVVDNYTRAVMPDECMLERDAFEGWYEENLDAALLSGATPSWMLEYVGPPGHCDPCLGDPLEPYELTDFGFQGDPAAALVSRVRMRYRADQLDEDLQLSLLEHPATQIRYIEHSREIEFAYPVCGEGFVADAGVCEGLLLPERREGGCATGGAPVGLLAVGLAVAAVRRRRLAPLVLLAALAAPRASSASESEARSPRFELTGTTTLVSTDRVRFAAYDRGGPHLLMPMLGLEARWPIFQAGAGHVGITGGLRGFVGNATPGEPDMPVDFRFVEPHAGLDIRWGTPRGQVAPTARAGLQAAFALLDTTAYDPRTTFGALLHASAGVYVGDGDHPLLVELQTSLVPRTDAWGVYFDPVVRMPDWIYYAGALDLSLVVGVAFR